LRELPSRDSVVRKGHPALPIWGWSAALR